MPPESPSTLLYAGIDEAGYGPTLGPLCVALGVVEVARWTPGARGAPDVWAMLKGAVCREGTEALRAGRIAVNDSKKLKLPNDSRARHPLVHLERAVLAALALVGPRPASDDDLFRALGVGPWPEEWYRGAPAAIPAAHSPEQAGILAATLAGATERAGVTIHPLRARAVWEGEFNDGLARRGSKAAVSFEAVGDLLRAVWDEHADRNDLDAHGPRVVVDRQGGRTSYAPLLQRLFSGARIETVREDEPRSRYFISETGAREAGRASGTASRRMTVTFEVEAEAAHFPVALASMTAKLVRELAMARFNRYWCGRIADLKPTAGYALDARRWLRDAAAIITNGERARMVRRA